MFCFILFFDITILEECYYVLVANGLFMNLILCYTMWSRCENVNPEYKMAVSGWNKSGQ